MDEKLNDIEKNIVGSEKDEELKKKLYNYIIITLFTISGIIIFYYIFFLVSFSPDKSSKNENEDEKKENCLKYDKDKKECISCNPGYKLIDGKCKENFSFIALYETEKNDETIELIYFKFKDQIININIDGNDVIYSRNYTFKNAGSHTVYMVLNISNTNDLGAMFYQIRGLKSIYFSKNFDTKNIKYMSNMFFYCKKLLYVNISNFDTQNVVYMNDLFHGCSSLTSVDISNFNANNVVYIHSLFKYCSSLTYAKLPNFNSGKITHMNSLFRGCTSLTSVDLSKFNTEKVMSISNLFDGCKSLTSVDLSKFETGKVQFMINIFNNCTNLRYIDISRFTNSSTMSYSNFCSHLPQIGTINAKKDFYENIKKFIPDSWVKILV